MQLKTILTPLVALAVLAAPAVHAQPRGDETLLEMHQAQRKGDRKRMATLLPQLRGHALEPWAAYWELRARLDTASADEVQAFLTRYADTYQEDRLRNDWLLLLGQRRDWAQFAAEYPRFRMNDDREVRCYALAMDHLRTGTDTSAEVRRLWHSLREADDGCTFAADRLHESRRLSDLDVWRKARLAMEYKRTRSAQAAVAIVAADAAPAINEIATQPVRYLASRATAGSRLRKELVVLALVRLAGDDPAQAAQLLENKWGVHLTPEERNWTWGAIGRQAANRLQDDAVEHFGKVTQDEDLSDEMLAWKVRASLRKGQWRAVLSATGAMSEDMRRDPAWTYWRARALLAGLPREEQARVASAGPESRPALQQARQLLESIASVRGFYEQLALEDLGQKVSVPARPAPLTDAEREAARLNPGLNRALYAIALGLRGEGVREWNYTTNLHRPGGMAERDLLAAADFACQRQVWDRCINTSERTRTAFDHEQRFPMPFREAVTARSRDIGLDPAYVYGLIRQESRFIMDARSHVGASGLMQVMPATARWTARRIGLNGFTPDQLNDRDTNITIGTSYLKLVLDDFAGSLPLAAAAYNAGPGRPRAWRNGPTLDAAIWAENVPFTETRDYVKKVLANTTVYAAILSGQPQSLRARLGQVGPRDASAPAENRDLP